MQSSPALGSPKDVLSIRDFRNLWIGQAISRIGDALYFLGPLFVVKKLFLIAQEKGMSIPVIAADGVDWVSSDLKDGMPENAIIAESIRLYEQEVNFSLGSK